jgi:hypothetical protein
MMPPDDPEVEPSEPELRLADLAMLIALKLEAGEPIDAGLNAERDPRCTDPIRRLLPTLHDLVAFGRAVNRQQRPGSTEFKPEADT